MAGERWTFTKQQIINTPSRKAGIEEEKELSYRQQAANFIQDMGQRLQVQQLVINTAIVYMHRFYMFHSFVRFHRNQIATASIFLAAKVEEQPRKLEHVIKVAHVCLHREGPPIDTKSEAYLEQAQELVINENILLQTLGFQILVEHPHTFIVKTCHVVKASRDLSQTSYFLATNSLHLTTMCLQYSPGLVACLCIHLACTWSDWKLGKSQDGTEWYHYIDKTVTQEKLDELTKEFLSVIEKCPSKLRKKIMTWKAQSGQAGSQSPSATPSSSSHKRGHGESSSAAGSAAALERKKSQSPVKHKDSPAKPNKEGKHSSSRASTPGSSVSKSRPNTTQEDVKRTKSDANKAKNYKEYKEFKEKGLLPEKSSTLTNSSQHDNIFDQYKTPNVEEDVKHEKTSTLSKMEGEPQYRDSSPDHRERSRENLNVKQPHIKTDPNNSSSRHLAKVGDHTVKKMDSPSYPKIKLKHDYPDLSRVKQEVQDTKTEHSGNKSNSPRLKLKTEYPDLSKVKQESNPEPSLKMKIKQEPNTEPTLKIKIKKDQLSDAWRSEHKKNRHSDVHREKVKDPHRSNPGPSQGGPDHRSHNAPSQGGPDHRSHNAPSQGGPDHRSHNAHQPNLDYNVNSDKHFNKIKPDSGRDYAGHGPPGPPGGGGGRPGDRKDPYRRHSGSGDPAYTSRKRPLSSPDMGSRPPHGFTSPHKHPRNNTSRYDQRHDTNGRHSYAGYGQSRGPPPRGPPINDYGPPDRPKDPYEDMYEQEDVPVSRSSTSSYEDSYEEPYSHDYPR